MTWAAASKITKAGTRSRNQGRKCCSFAIKRRIIKTSFRSLKRIGWEKQSSYCRLILLWSQISLFSHLRSFKLLFGTRSRFILTQLNMRNHGPIMGPISIIIQETHMGRSPRDIYGMSYMRNFLLLRLSIISIKSVQTIVQQMRATQAVTDMVNSGLSNLFRT